MDLVESWSFEFLSQEVKKSAALVKKRGLISNRNEASEEIIKSVLAAFARHKADAFQYVINGSGVILHTNLGRAPISNSYWEIIKNGVTGYSNLEFDISDGARSKRGRLAHKMLALLAGAEDGLIVNNNAAAVFMAVANMSRRKEVIISRGQLVQIGGGFRIPEIIERTGSKMKEVGTTNKTALNDYKKSINRQTGLILVVHKSNFAQRGFVEEPDISGIVKIAKNAKIPVCYDIGSGLLSSDLLQEPHDEPDIKTAVRTGADIVCFSGDKLLGGPQCGLLVGKRKFISAMTADPLYRTFRPDKIAIGLMEMVIRDYLAGNHSLPIWMLAKTSSDTLKARAQHIIMACGSKNLSLVSTKSSFGGGSLPEYEIDSAGIFVEGESKIISEKLRKYDPPIIARITSKGVTIDLRTVFPNQDDILIAALKKCL